jgi:hypothetical protein
MAQCSCVPGVLAVLLRCVQRLGTATVATILFVFVAMACAGAAGASTQATATSPTPTATSTPLPPPEATRNTKLALLNQLTTAPDMLIFGSSRAMRINPAAYAEFTGRCAFNLAVSSGTVADAYCMSRYVHDRFPGTVQRYLWMLDVEQLRLERVHQAIYAQAELAPYVPAGFPSPYSGSPVPVSPPAPAPGPPYGAVDVFDANGYLRWNRYDYYRTRHRTLAAGVAYSRWKFGKVYPKGYQTVKGVAKWFVNETIKQMNEWGVAPVIVLTPYQPSLLSFISGRGYKARRAAVLAFFTQLSKQGRQFVLLDCTRISSFGGWAHGFYDGTHMRTTLSRILLLYVVNHSGGLL